MRHAWLLQSPRQGSEVQALGRGGLLRGSAQEGWHERRQHRSYCDSTMVLMVLMRGCRST